MSERAKRAFYGGDGNPPILGVIASLRTLIGSDEWPQEIVQACDVNYFERVCGASVVLMKMPPWVC
jgi:hypothetical protein